MLYDTAQLYSLCVHAIVGGLVDVAYLKENINRKVDTMSKGNRFITMLLVLVLVLSSSLVMAMPVAAAMPIYVNVSTGNYTDNGQAAVWNGTRGPNATIIETNHSLVDAVITADSVGGNGTDNCTSDMFRLVRNGPDVVFYIDGKLSESFAFDSLDAIIVDGSGDDDTLTVDLSQGTPVPHGGLTYNGRGNGSGGDSLEIVGGTLSSVQCEYTGLSDGVITIDGSIIRYTGLEPIIDTMNATSSIIDGTN